MNKETWNIEVFIGKEATPYLEQLAELRIQVFKEFPYLYLGDISYERSYLKKFIDTPNSIIAIATDRARVVGASTGLPLALEDESVQKPWKEKFISIDQHYYFSESILVKEYRKQGIGRRLFEIRELTALDFNKFHTFTFCSVLRPTYHELKPADYKPLHSFWKKFGYHPIPNMLCKMSWLDVGEEEPTEKFLQFWAKYVGNNYQGDPPV